MLGHKSKLQYGIRTHVFLIYKQTLHNSSHCMKLFLLMKGKVTILLLLQFEPLIRGQEKKPGRKKTYCLDLTQVELREVRGRVGDMGLCFRVSLSLSLPVTPSSISSQIPMTPCSPDHLTVPTRPTSCSAQYLYSSSGKRKVLGPKHINCE